MNSRKHWFALFALLTLSLLVYYGLRYRRKAQESNVPEPAAAKAESAQSQAGQITPDNQAVAAAFNPGQSPRPQTAPPAMTREQKLELAPNYMNVPISFFGRVVDQDGNPLSGVQVVVSVRQWHHPVASVGLDSSFPKTELATDEGGYFQFANGSGDDLRIEALAKEGFEAEPKALRGFGYNTSERFTPDQKNPVVFRMWKTGTKQPLVTGDIFLPTIPDGRTYTLNLLKGTVAEGESEGDLRIAIKRSPDAAWGKKYEWSFELAVVNGGLKEESDAYESMYLAPEGDYAKKVTMDFQPGEGWTYAVSKRFYLKARNGQLSARMDVEIQAFYLKDKQGRFGIKYAVNPTGERTLR